MTPQEKAKELVDKFSTVGLQQRNEGIACAIIAVEEILSIRLVHQDSYLTIYWGKIKEEIERL